LKLKQARLPLACLAVIAAALAFLSLPHRGVSSQQPQLGHQEKAVPCKDDISEKAAAIARQKYPRSLPPEEWRKGRNFYILKHGFDLFDINHDGFLEFDEYLSWQWAGYLVEGPAGKCVVSRSDFLGRFLGTPNTPSSGWSIPYQARIYNDVYNSIDLDHKGYITKSDIIGRTLRSFSFSDKNHDGKISPDELN
jgi:hypothetical protein